MPCCCSCCGVDVPVPLLALMLALLLVLSLVLLPPLLLLHHQPKCSSDGPPAGCRCRNINTSLAAGSTGRNGVNTSPGPAKRKGGCS
jgi:hypothetical protein